MAVFGLGLDERRFFWGGGLFDDLAVAHGCSATHLLFEILNIYFTFYPLFILSMTNIANQSISSGQNHINQSGLSSFNESKCNSKSLNHVQRVSQFKQISVFCPRTQAQNWTLTQSIVHLELQIYLLPLLLH